MQRGLSMTLQIQKIYEYLRVSFWQLEHSQNSFFRKYTNTQNLCICVKIILNILKIMWIYNVTSRPLCKHKFTNTQMHKSLRPCNLADPSYLSQSLTEPKDQTHVSLFSFFLCIFTLGIGLGFMNKPSPKPNADFCSFLWHICWCHAGSGSHSMSWEWSHHIALLHNSMSMHKVHGWISKHLSLPTPKANSGSENCWILEYLRSNIDAVNCPEQEPPHNHGYWTGPSCAHNHDAIYHTTLPWHIATGRATNQKSTMVCINNLPAQHSSTRHVSSCHSRIPCQAHMAISNQARSIQVLARPHIDMIISQ